MRCSRRRKHDAQMSGTGVGVGLKTLCSRGREAVLQGRAGQKVRTIRTGGNAGI